MANEKEFNHSMPIEQWAEEMNIVEDLINTIGASLEGLLPDVVKYLNDREDDEFDDAFVRQVFILVRQWYLKNTEE